MRILQVSFWGPMAPEARGMEGVIHQIAKGLAKHGYPVDVAYCSPSRLGKSYRFRKYKRNLNLIQIEVPNLKFFGKLRHSLSKVCYNKNLRNFIRENGKTYDIIHVHGDNGGFKELSNYNTVATFHGFALTYARATNFLHRFILRICSIRYEFGNIQYSKRLVAVSESVASQISRYTNKNIDVIYNGIDTRRFRPLSSIQKRRVRQHLKLDQNTKYVLCIAGDPLRKGLDTAIEIMKKLKENVVLLVVGPNSYKGVNSQNILFLGHLSSDKLLKIFQVSDLFLAPAKYEGFSLAALEALSCGLPVITSTWAKEILENNKNGFIIKQNDIEYAAKIIQRLIAEASFYSKISKNSRKVAIKYDTEKMVNKYIEMYKSMLNDTN